MDYHSIQGRVRKHSQLPRKLGWVRPDVLLGSDAKFTFYLLLIILCKIAVGRVRAPHHNEKVKQEINNVSTMQDIFPNNDLIAFVTKRWSLKGKFVTCIIKNFHKNQKLGIYRLVYFTKKITHR